LAEEPKDNRFSNYARKGAEARLAELMAEIEFIYRTFPQLRGAQPGAVAPAASAAREARPRRKPKWTPAMKKEAADRMKKYWAGRRATSRKPAGRE